METEPSKTPLATSWSASGNSTVRCNLEVASQRASLLFGCYRRGDAADPDTYVMAITAVLSTFQEATVMYVTDPRSGLASAIQWLPSVAEVSKACEDREAYLAKQADYDRRFAGRVAMPRLPRVTRDPGQEFEAMFEKCGRPLGLNERGTKWEQCVGQGRKIPPVGFKHVAAEWKSPTDEQLRARYGTKAEEAK